MPSKERILRERIEEYLRDGEEKGLSQTTIKHYRGVLNRLMIALMDAKLATNPKKIGKKELLYIKDEYLTCGEATKKWMIETLTGYCKWAGNFEIGKVILFYGDTSRKRVGWLSDEQAAIVDANAIGIERLVIHLMKDLGLRRIEVIRLSLKSFDLNAGKYGRVTIHGKGRLGGKYRTITCHPRTRHLFMEYVHGIRAEEIAKVRKLNPKAKIPDHLLIYANESGRCFGEYQKTAIDKMVQRVSGRVGFHFTNHDLRRTCGREMYFARVEIEKIAHILGHTDTKTTMKYLGLEFMDMDESMSAYFEHQQKQWVSCPENGAKVRLAR